MHLLAVRRLRCGPTQLLAVRQWRRGPAQLPAMLRWRYGPTQLLAVRRWRRRPAQLLAVRRWRRRLTQLLAVRRWRCGPTQLLEAPCARACGGGVATPHSRPPDNRLGHRAHWHCDASRRGANGDQGVDTRLAVCAAVPASQTAKWLPRNERTTPWTMRCPARERSRRAAGAARRGRHPATRTIPPPPPSPTKLSAPQRE
jgi:hypothetical protein